MRRIRRSRNLWRSGLSGRGGLSGACGAWRRVEWAPQKSLPTGWGGEAGMVFRAGLESVASQLNIKNCDVLVHEAMQPTKRT